MGMHKTPIEYDTRMNKILLKILMEESKKSYKKVKA